MTDSGDEERSGAGIRTAAAGRDSRRLDGRATRAGRCIP